MVMRVFGALRPQVATGLPTRPLTCGVGACQCRRVQALLAADVYGRHAELSALRAFVAADRRVGALLLIGAAGIGKTALWGAALRMARASGRFVMAARPAGAEAGMAFAGLIDLCDRLGAEALADLPAPQRTALEVALRRAEPPRGAAPDAHAIALAFLNVLRRMAVDRPLVVAIDDLPWLDPLSVSVLTFAARRLGDEPVTFLLARRPGSPSPLELELAPERVEVGALEPSALRRLLASRLAVFPSLVLLRRIIDVSQGNALFALELGRSVCRAGSLASSPYVTLPDTVEDALGARTVALAPGVRRLLLDPDLADLPMSSSWLAATHHVAQVAAGIVGPFGLVQYTRLGPVLQQILQVPFHIRSPPPATTPHGRVTSKPGSTAQVDVIGGS
jgi:hypothetical protein